MPEGPEVKNLVDWLNKELKKDKITKIIIHSGRYSKNKKPENLNKIMFPLIIKKIECKGKFIYWTFKNSNYIMYNTLGMTGWWTFDNEKHNNIEFVLGKESIFFNDFRNFGTVSFQTKEHLEKKLNCLGPDILKKNNIVEFKKRLEKKRDDTYIASALLDQKVACGCGNYLRAECLYIAKISPYKTIKNLTEQDIEKIWDILKQLAWTYYNESKGKRNKIINNKYVLYRKNIKKGPSKYKPESDTFLVYRQKTDPHNNIVTSEDINGRTIHYVKHIQKK